MEISRLQNVGQRGHFELLVDEIKQLIQDDFLEDFEESDIEIIDNNIFALNNYIPLIVEEIAAFYDKEEDSVLKDSGGNVIGYLCFSRRVNDFTEFTDVQLVAYLANNIKSAFESGEYIISKDYVVLKKEYYSQYIEKYYDSAPVWGGFSHTTVQNAYQINVDSIVVRETSLPTEYHKESVVRAIQQPYAFERFLKTFHLLELLFDYDLIMEIKSLPEELKGLSTLLKEFNKRDELSRLNKVIIKRKSKIDFVLLEKNISKVLNHLDKAKEIFFEYGKEGNPIPSDEKKLGVEKFNEIISRNDPFQIDNLKQTMKGLNSQEKYEKFLLELSTYWIYRIRCSIAHYKIGEYLMSYDDEEFIVNFIEPILKQIVLDCFDNQDEI